jgi:hypothetical protein
MVIEKSIFSVELIEIEELEDDSDDRHYFKVKYKHT